MVGVDMAAVVWWTWFVAFVAVALVLWFGRRKGTRIPPWRSIAIVVGILIVASVLPRGLGRVQPGARGVLLRFGAPTGRILAEGVYYVVPLVDTVVQVNTQNNTVNFDRAQGLCSDLEPVYADMAVTFHVDPARVVDVYRGLRNAYVVRLVKPAVQESLKATTARYAAPDLIAKRPQVQRELLAEVRERLLPFGLVADSVNMTRFQYAYGYAQAAQAKVASVQHTAQAQQELQRIRYVAQQNVVRVEAEVRALKLERNVSGKDLLRSRELDLQRRAIDKWDGHLPQATGSSTLPFMQRVLEGKSD